MHGSMEANQKVTAVLGPTNTGKTHYAVERMLAHRSGMIGLPLRLLAREVYQRIVARIGAQDVALITGEERIVPASPRYWVSTVEAMPVQMATEFVAIDEVQTATDLTRGHIFTHRILNCRGISETLLLGAATMGPLLNKLIPDLEIISRPRLSQLFYAGSKKITRQPRRSAIIAFSAREVYAIAELVRRQRGGAAIVMGALSPHTRNAQVEMYENGDVDFLVATDAIGMGLNLDVHHVAFSSLQKFDGRQFRDLTPAEMGQIAGRAGRHTRDGTFGITGHAPVLEPEMVEQLQNHQFAPVKVLQWRNPSLDFSSAANLLAALNKPADKPGLTRIPNVTDQMTLESLLHSGLRDQVDDKQQLKLLWEVCQIPDYREISPAQHCDIVASIFNDLTSKGQISTDWIADQVHFCDNVQGDIDTLSNRIKQIRTWTYVSNRKNWLDDAKHWRETTFQIEHRLSDALHQKLTQRFVDRRTSVLMRHLRDKRMANPQITDTGEIEIEGHKIGAIEGLRFNLAPAEGEADAKALRATASSVLTPELKNRAMQVAAAPNNQIILSTDGMLRWKGQIVAELAQGDKLLKPKVIVLCDESMPAPERDAVQERLSLWVRHAINTQLEQINTLLDGAELEGAAAGIAFRLAENLGIIARAEIAEEVRNLDQDLRAKMRKLGIKFGAYHIYLPTSLKPAPREIALILFALANGGIRQKGVTELPSIVMSGRTSIAIDPEIDPRLYEIAGFKVAGPRAVRVDILERLADIIRPLISFNTDRTSENAPEGAGPANGFRVTVEMTSLLGCAGEDFAAILKSLNYRLDRRPLPKAVPEPSETEATAEATPTSAEDTATADTPAQSADIAPAQPQETSETPQSLDGEAEPEEPQFDEIWFPPRRNAGRNQQANKNHSKQNAGRKNRNHGQRPGGQNKSSGKNAKPGGNKEKRERPIDPDSPFAALAALKQK